MQSRDSTHENFLKAIEQRDRWIRLFNRLEGAVAHWRKATTGDGDLFAADEALVAAHDRVLKEATKGA